MKIQILNKCIEYFLNTFEYISIKMEIYIINGGIIQKKNKNKKKKQKQKCDQTSYYLLFQTIISIIY